MAPCPRGGGHSEKYFAILIMNPNIPTDLFRSFIAICDHGSFTRAAREMNLTQPAISAQMKRLQKVLGGDLFVKRGQGVGPTTLGSMVESYARRVLALNDQVFAIAGRVPKGETVYIGIQSIFVRSVLSSVVGKLPTASFGGLPIHLRERPISGGKTEVRLRRLGFHASSVGVPPKPDCRVGGKAHLGPRSALPCAGRRADPVHKPRGRLHRP